MPMVESWRIEVRRSDASEHRSAQLREDRLASRPGTAPATSASQLVPRNMTPTSTAMTVKRHPGIPRLRSV